MAKSQPLSQLGRRYRSVFSGKNYCKEFLFENRRLERGGIVPPSYLHEGTLHVKRDFNAVKPLA